MLEFFYGLLACLPHAVGFLAVMLFGVPMLFGARLPGLNYATFFGAFMALAIGESLYTSTWLAALGVVAGGIGIFAIAAVRANQATSAKPLEKPSAGKSLTPPTGNKPSVQPGNKIGPAKPNGKK